MSKLDIYELKGVYGDEEKLDSSYNRLGKMLQLVDSLPSIPKKILDVGCGTGMFADLLKQKFPESEVVGIDISKKALSLGKEKYRDVKFIFADAEKTLPFKDMYFDLVISGEHIEHLVDVDSYLDEINRVTKKNGYLLLTTPNLASWMNRMLLFCGLQPWYLDASYRKNLPIFSIGSFRFPENPGAPSAGHLRLFTLNILKKLLLSTGYKTEQVVGAKIMAKPLLKQIDTVFSFIPSLAFGVIILAKKYEK